MASELFDLTGRCAVVTGASSGIGQAIGFALAGAGADVVGLSLDVGAETAAEIERLGRRSLQLVGDTAVPADLEHTADAALETFGRLDVWVNNAGVDVLTGDAAGWDWERKLDALLAVDLKGTIACSYAAGEVMRGQEGGGTILNMSWDHATTGMAGDDPQLFAAVKGGVLSFSKSLARALAPAVRVNVLSPGWIETSFGEQVDREFHRSVAQDTPLGRWGRPTDVADAALYLASPEAAFITGQAINVNGGVVM
jgi:3-oxoacyl-[acyl-carrier protein] reductase